MTTHKNSLDGKAHQGSPGLLLLTAGPHWSLINDCHEQKWLFVSNNMMDKLWLTQWEQGKQPTGTPTAQAKTQEETSRRGTKVSKDRVKPADML